MVVALIDPLTVLACSKLGFAAPGPALLPKLFAPTALAVVTAVIASRINCRLGSKLQAARELGSYRLLEQLGRGGMGEVWRAEHKMLARPAAIKLIRSDILAWGGDELVQARLRSFEREARATALLESEHTIELYDFGVTTDGAFYYVMELLEGLDLEDLVQGFGPMPLARAIHCLLQVCESLDEAHQKGLIHRDIKPSNIFLCRRGLKYDCIKVLDFGLVKASGLAHPSGTPEKKKVIAGTPAFMAPEILLGREDIDGRVDVYALGCVAYWLLSGELAFAPGEGIPALTAARAEQAPPARLSERAQQRIPASFEEIVHSCFARDPASRPQTAHELGARLRAVPLDEQWTQDAARSWWEAHGPELAKMRQKTPDAVATTATSAEDIQATKDTVPIGPPRVRG